MKGQLVILGVGLLTIGIIGCAKLLPGQDPIVVRTEQVETQTYSILDTFLKLDDTINANSKLAPSWTAAHAFAQHLRTPVQSQKGIMVPLGIATILSVDQIKLAYVAGTTTSNALITAVNVLSTTVIQIQQYQSLTNGF